MSDVFMEHFHKLQVEQDGLHGRPEEVGEDTVLQDRRHKEAESRDTVVVPAVLR